MCTDCGKLILSGDSWWSGSTLYSIVVFLCYTWLVFTWAPRVLHIDSWGTSLPDCTIATSCTPPLGSHLKSEYILSCKHTFLYYIEKSVMHISALKIWIKPSNLILHTVYTAHCTVLSSCGRRCVHFHPIQWSLSIPPVTESLPPCPVVLLLSTYEMASHTMVFLQEWTLHVSLTYQIVE